jgi:hypothetical protein
MLSNILSAKLKFQEKILFMNGNNMILSSVPALLVRATYDDDSKMPSIPCVKESSHRSAATVTMEINCSYIVILEAVSSGALPIVFSPIPAKS